MLGHVGVLGNYSYSRELGVRSCRCTGELGTAGN